MSKEETENVGQDDSGEKDAVWVKNYTALGWAMNPPRDRVFMQRYAKLPGAPKPRQNGGHHVPSWQRFLDENTSNLPHDKSEKAASERTENLSLRNEKARIELEMMRGGLISVDEVERTLSETFAEFSKRLKEMADGLSTKLVGLDSPGAVKKCLTKEIRSVLLCLSNVSPDVSDPKKKAFWGRVSEVLSDLRRTYDLGPGPRST